MLRISLVVLVVLLLIAGGVGAGYWLRDQNVFKTEPSQQQSEATSTPSPTASAAPTGTQAAACVSNNLTVSVAPETGGGAAGSVYYAVSLKNAGEQACTLTGYPGVSLINANDQQVGQPAGRSETDNAATVTLQPDTSASATMRVVQNNFDPGVCKDGATQLKVFPPNSTVALTTKTTVTTWCPGFTIGPFKAQ